MERLMTGRFREPLGVPRASVQVDTNGCDQGRIGCWRRGGHSCFAPSRIWSFWVGRRFAPSRSVNQRGAYPSWALLLARTNFAHCLMLPDRSVNLLDWRCADDSLARAERQILLTIDRNSAGVCTSRDSGRRHDRTQGASGVGGVGSGSESKPVLASRVRKGRKAAVAMF
jgi:hypothetical protein